MADTNTQDVIWALEELLTWTRATPPSRRTSKKYEQEVAFCIETAIAEIRRLQALVSQQSHLTDDPDDQE